MSEREYYIRARGKIRGPFGMAQLRALRERGQFSSFHEVSVDRQMWSSAAGLIEVFAPLARTEDTYPLAGSGSGRRASPGIPRTPSADGWYYLNNSGQQRGPVSKNQLLCLRQDGAIQDSTLIWREGLADWRPLGAAESGLPANPNDEFAVITAARQSGGGMAGGIDKMLWYDANKKSVFVAYLLWWFLGTFGAHRFYFGKIATAVGMLLLPPLVILLFILTVASSFALKIKDVEVYVFLLVLFWTAVGATLIWWFIDAFLIPVWTRDYNNRLIRRLQ